MVEGCLGIFYMDDGVVVSQDPECIQGALNFLIGLLHRYTLVLNFVRSKSMTCHPGTLRSRVSEEAVGQHCTGRGDKYRERLRRRILFPDCGVELNAGSMTAHRRCTHGTGPEIDWNQIPVSQMEHITQLFDIILLTGTSQCPCPFPICPVFFPDL